MTSWARDGLFLVASVLSSIRTVLPRNRQRLVQRVASPHGKHAWFSRSKIFVWLSRAHLKHWQLESFHELNVSAKSMSRLRPYHRCRNTLHTVLCAGKGQEMLRDFIESFLVILTRKILELLILLFFLQGKSLNWLEFMAVPHRDSILVSIVVVCYMKSLLEWKST
jgi:hypothetical protein